MRRRSIRSRRGLLAVAALVVVVVISGLLSIDRYGAPAQPPPGALDHVAEKNRRAAMIAAENQRAEAAAATDAAEGVAEAERRGAADAEATLERFPDSETAR